MPTDNRLSRILHALLHIERHKGAVTSEALAKMLNTNPVFVRRMMSGLRQAGLVHSEKGHGGGWTLARGLDAISLRDVYEALGSPGLFAMGLSEDHPHCLVEQAVNASLAEAMQAADALLLDRFAAVSLSDLARDFDKLHTGVHRDA